MDSKEREAPQSFRPINKRPWEAETSRENISSWNGARLPPIETVPYKKPHVIADLPDSFEAGRAYSPYARPNSRDSTSHKASFEGSGHGDASFWSKEKVPPLNERRMLSPRKTPVFNPTYSTSRLLALPYEQSPSSKNTFVISEPANSQDTSYLCRRCKRDLKEEETRLFDSCEACSQSPDLAYLTQATAAGLTHLAETLQTGKSTDQPFTPPAHGKVHSSSSDCPLIADAGLNASLSWILGKVYEVNRLADQLIQHVPREAPAGLGQDYFAEELAARDGIDKMKRRWAPDSEDASRRGGDDFDPASTDQRQRSSIASISVGDELPPMRTQSPYQLGGSTMHPPPAPSRQLPSPPGRQLPSPTSLNFPSPGAASYSSQSTNIPSGVHQPISSHLLPSISGLSGETATAVQAHSAALQHEVSVQKIALSSLQGEHDKLLAAFSRSQTRASALEKKHAVSDSEIITLTEEKIRLQQQVTELERDIEEVSRSRDTFREAAVQESSQYVEIVQRASRLEEMALGERKAWNALKAKMEQEIGLLRSGRDTGEGSKSESHDSVTQTAQATSPSQNQGQMKIEGDMNESSTDDPTINTEQMREEIQRLKSRCIRAEETLRAVRADTVRIVGLFSTAGKDIVERVDDVLKDDGLQSRPDE